jgi:putative ABC transport system permease protein
VFNFPLVEGDATTALAKPNTMIITETAAAKLFGDKNPMGELAFIQPFGEVLITGVAKDVPKNSHMRFEAVVSYATLTSRHGPSLIEDENNWDNFFGSYTYLLLSNNTATDPIEDFLNGIAKEKYTTDDFRATLQRSNWRS